MSSRRSWSRWVWLAGLVGLVGLHFWFPSVPTGNGNDTFGIGEEGKKAFYLLVDEEHRTVSRNMDSFERFIEREYGGGLLCVLGASREPTPREWTTVLEWVASGGSLVYAFPFEVFDRPLALGEERLESVRVPEIGVTLVPATVGAFFDSERSGDDLDVRTQLVEDTSRLAWRAGAEIESQRGEVLLTVDDSVQAVKVRHGAGWVVVVATDEPFTNYELVVGDGGVLGYRLLETAGLRGDVYFDESLNESATPKAVAIILAPDVRPLTIQLVLVLFLFCWWNRERFGPPLPERVSAQQDVVGHGDALGTLVHMSGDGRGALRTYYQQLLGELGLGRGETKKSHRVLGPIARRLGVDVDRVLQVLREAARASEDARLSRREAARQISRLAKIRRAVGQ